MPSHRLGRYVLACVIVAAATFLRALVDPLIHDQIPYFIYVASVVVTTWLCGFEAGILGTVVAAFVGNYFFVVPRYEIVPHGEDWNAMGLFAGVAFGLVWLVSRWRSAEQSLRKHADDLQALNVEAERINRLKDEFLATLSHELRTPLSAVLGWAQILESGSLDAGQQRHAIETIVRNAKAQARLVEDILDVSAIVSGKLALHVSPLDLATVVSSRHRGDSPGGRRQENRGANLVRAAFADGRRCRPSSADRVEPAVERRQVQRQGRRGGRPHRAPRFAAGLDGRGYRQGNRPGVPAAPVRAVPSSGQFEDARHGGLGLGLAIVRHMVELHGGTVSAESAGSNRGSTFTVTFPIRAVAAGPAEVPRARPAGAGADSVRARVSLAGIRVLAVDDEPDARELVAFILKEYGAEVRVAASAKDAFQELRTWRPDVLVADIGMPVEDGYSLLRRIRALSPNEGGAIPAAALTAYAQAEDRDRAFAAGFQEHVSKPVIAQELARLVATLARMPVVRAH